MAVTPRAQLGAGRCRLPSALPVWWRPKPRSPTTTTGKVERFHQTLQRELLTDHPPFTSLTDAQAAIDTFRDDYNVDRPHQSLDMAVPADRFTTSPVVDAIPLRLPPSLASTDTQTANPAPTQAPPASPPIAAAAPATLAVKVTRTVPASGNLGLCGQQFWLGPIHATTVVHLLLDGVRLKTVPSRLRPDHLRQLLADGGRPAGPPPITVGPTKPGEPIEVDRLATTNGLLALAGRRHPVGYHPAGRRVIARLDHGVLHILDTDRSLLRSLPNPLAPADLLRLRDARPGEPPPAPAPPSRCGSSGGPTAAAPSSAPARRSR
ncbi:integrase core domain-containing protein [Planosporangium sp. 12N6]|uniref:integrase core domain-containing protein n=1 Tax=Planosporangium spinosum TaxID=3402278 RepID=UPI003CE6D918